MSPFLSFCPCLVPFSLVSPPCPLLSPSCPLLSSWSPSFPPQGTAATATGPRSHHPRCDDCCFSNVPPTHPLVTLQGRFLELGPRSAEDAKFWPYLDPAGRGKQKCEARLLHLCFPLLPIGKGGGPVTEHQAIEPRCDLQRLARLPQHVSPPARIHIRACVLLPPQPS